MISVTCGSSISGVSAPQPSISASVVSTKAARSVGPTDTLRGPGRLVEVLLDEPAYGVVVDGHAGQPRTQLGHDGGAHLGAQRLDPGELGRRQLGGPARGGGCSGRGRVGPPRP